MASYKDLSACDYFGPCDASLIAIGWLAAEKPDYSRGAVSAAFFEALLRLLTDPWQPVALAGMQECFVCRFTGGPTELRYASTTVALGSANLFVPADDCVFVAPSLIAHYIDAHDYAPPAEFQQAVMNCPTMRSIAYLKMVMKHGVHRLGARV
jgi:hypothetical protein